MANQAAQELQSFVRRIESVEDEINALNADKSEIYKEAKSNGFTPKTLRKVVAKRRIGETERDEQDTEFELYWNAVHGIDPDLVRAHVETVDEFPVEHDEDGVFSDEELPPPSRGTGGEDDLREPVATEQGQIAQEGDAPLEVDATAPDEVMPGHDEHLSTHSVTNITTLRQPKPLRPNCLKPEMCGGQGRQHCWACTKAMNEVGAA